MVLIPNRFISFYSVYKMKRYTCVLYKITLNFFSFFPWGQNNDRSDYSLVLKEKMFNSQKPQGAEELFAMQMKRKFYRRTSRLCLLWNLLWTWSFKQSCDRVTNLVKCSVGTNVARRATNSESEAFRARHEVPRRKRDKGRKLSTMWLVQCGL